MESFIFFWRETGKDGYLSQWYVAPFEVEGIIYQSAEQYMMAKKALMFHDSKIYNQIMNELDCKKIKALGRKVHNFDADEWSKSCFKIVCEANYAKFTQNSDLKEMLLKTGNRTLAEASPYDKIWGIGMRASHPDIHDRSKWKGKNLLGEALMKTRDRIGKIVD